MKTIKLLALLFVSAIILEGCNEKPAHPGEPTVGGPIAPPKTIIDVQEAEDMYHRYGKDIAPILEKNNPNLKATRSLSIDYKTLKDYIAFIDQEAAAANDTKISGLRIYFAKYEDSKNDGRATVFLNPIMEAGAIGDLRDDVSFAIKTENGKSTAVPVGKLIKKPTTGSNRADLTMPIQNGVQSLAANDFPWSPPPNSDPDDYQ
ncbi:hypothetical protein [Dokdonia donghaensis]|uniref:Uncharacterized protein n=2 Tax=Dokdonia TaxID=326319 RepID=A0A0A2GTG7_9FLAO|nr:hypothetical protein [Dokdonia donghaensis]ANH59107.1 hypothetical protein I597_0173 [Dokdonia donghaensis DSW-1]KGO06532.1 hypothetical protein NV36_06555 [Dokdonia donghaensis DSW-1]